MFNGINFDFLRTGASRQDVQSFKGDTISRGYQVLQGWHQGGIKQVVTICTKPSKLRLTMSHWSNIMLQNYVSAERHTRSSTLRGAIASFLSCYGTPSYPASMSSMWRPERVKTLVRNFVCKLQGWYELVIQFLGMIKDCIWKGRRLSCSGIVTMQPTDQGMCCSFNKERADRMLQQSRYQEQLLRLREQDKTHSRDDSELPDGQAQIIIKTNFNYAEISFKCNFLQV